MPNLKVAIFLWLQMLNLTDGFCFFVLKLHAARNYYYISHFIRLVKVLLLAFHSFSCLLELWKYFLHLLVFHRLIRSRFWAILILLNFYKQVFSWLNWFFVLVIRLYLILIKYCRRFHSCLRIPTKWFADFKPNQWAGIFIVLVFNFLGSMRKDASKILALVKICSKITWSSTKLSYLF
jgi:hypothetical protein